MSRIKQRHGDWPRYRRLTSGATVLSLMVLLGGCEVGNPTVTSVTPEDTIQLIEVDRDDFDQVVAQFRGEVVFVDFWATWCEPCMELFPHTVELHRRFAGRGLTVLSVACDEPDEPARVRRFLHSNEAFDLVNLISKDGGGEKTFADFEIERGLPHFKLYDRRGRLRYTFDVDTRELDKRIHELLAQTTGEVYSDDLDLTPEERALFDRITGESAKEKDAE